MFNFYNPNPKMKREDDCVIRAIAKATGLDWDSVYARVVAQGYEAKAMPSTNHVWSALLRKLGFKRRTIPNTCPDCYTVADFCKDNPQGVYILATGSHVVTAIDGNYFDTWDSGEEVPVIYFTKEQVNG